MTNNRVPQPPISREAAEFLDSRLTAFRDEIIQAVIHDKATKSEAEDEITVSDIDNALIRLNILREERAHERWYSLRNWRRFSFAAMGIFLTSAVGILVNLLTSSSDKLEIADQFASVLSVAVGALSAVLAVLVALQVRTSAKESARLVTHTARAAHTSSILLAWSQLERIMRQRVANATGNVATHRNLRGVIEAYVKINSMSSDEFSELLRILETRNYLAHQPEKLDEVDLEAVSALAQKYLRRAHEHR